MAKSEARFQKKHAFNKTMKAVSRTLEIVVMGKNSRQKESGSVALSLPSFSHL